MAFYTMSEKTLVETFTKIMSYDDILNTQYCIISTKIRVNGKHQNVSSASRLYPSASICSEYYYSKNDAEFEDTYRKQLYDERGCVAIFASTVISDGADIVILYDESETSFPYIPVISSVIEDITGLPVYDFKKLVDKEVKYREYDKDDAIRKINKIIKKTARNRYKMREATVEGRTRNVSEMSKSDMRRKLKDIDLYRKGMSKKDMKQRLITNYVCDVADDD